MKRLLRATPLAALLTLACDGELKPADQLPYVGPCEGLAPLTLSAEPTTVRSGSVATLTAGGGSGHYSFRAEAGGSSGDMRGNRFVAGATPGEDTLTVVDEQCGGATSVRVKVIAGFGVAPARAVLRPGTSFQIRIDGLVGTAAFTLTTNGSGATLTDAGVYTAGQVEAQDVITVRDTKSGDTVALQYTVSKAAKLVGDPLYLGVPSGSSAPLGTAGGSDTVTWTKKSGPGSVVNGRVVVEAGAAGTIVLEAKDTFTGDVAAVSVRVLDELTRPLLAHGKLSDVATLVTADFDGDGIQDLAVGQRESELARPTGGAVFIYKGSTSGLPVKPTWVLTGETEGALFGDMMAAGDLDGDGIADLAVSSPAADVTIGDSGAVYLYTFKPGQAPALLRPALTGLGRGGFGTGLAIADADGDGDMDLFVGSPGADLSTLSGISRRGVIDIFILTKGQAVPDLPVVRLGGQDVKANGDFELKSTTELGRALVVADLNDDGRPDLAALHRLTRFNADGSTNGQQMAVAVYFARDTAPRYRSAADLYVLVSNTAVETMANEGTFRLGAIPGEGSRPPFLLVMADKADAPDLRTSGGVAAAQDAGGAYLFDLRGATLAADPATAKPATMPLANAYARFYGDARSITATRSWAVMDVDGTAGPELLLGAPYASVTSGTTTLGNAGKVLVYPLTGLSKDTVMNKPLAALGGAAKAEVLGAGLAAWNLQSGPVLAGFSGRASSSAGAFVGRVDVFSKAGASIAEWSRSVMDVTAKASVERFGETVAVSRLNGKVMALVGSPGFSGPGPNNDGADMTVGRAYTFDTAEPGKAIVSGEGASSPWYGGRNVGVDVAFTDFNGDGRPDMVAAATALTIPATNSAAAERDPYVANACMTTATQALGGLLVSAGQADGTFKPAYRVFAPSVVTDCHDAANTRCKRTTIGRGVVGGFDFNGDGKQDLAVLRDRGIDVFLGRAPEDASLAKMTLACNPVWSWPTEPMPATPPADQGGWANTTMPATSALATVGDLNGDGCDEVAWRYSDNAHSGIVIAYGYDAGGVKCGARTVASMVRIAGDPEKKIALMNLGIATTRAGKFLGDSRDFLAVTANNYLFEGVNQPTVLLFDVAAINAKRPASGEAVVGAINDGLTPIPVTYRARAVSFGTSLSGGRDLNGDGVPDLWVGAPNASVASDGDGAAFLFAGGAKSTGALSPFLLVVGDGAERSYLGQSIAVVPGSGGSPPSVVIGAPRSYRTGTQNGTAYSLPLPF
ncbi:FG-GAP repeat-containing protein [Corallococcus coralloides DSM 2259]|uniref:FG-GAP repeat-containing protein n=1 Tax=Corallococcus coralloides (strain ATCC 25202 / DSM 2259 / NBRC 100086 / M2) TaxID=1144275 RepID=H8MLH2_CORCM|nr:VCBS repeat-containing protein [Corallococcus coralloides]AFE03802.1 FG-GAP repeat-containing protein [Corallococcus coralloides DSM 2259]